MSLEAIWKIYREQGYAAAQAVEAAAAPDHFYQGLLAYGEGDISLALESVRAAATLEPHIRVYAQSVIYLERVLAQDKQGVYVDGKAFAAFIRGGGNVPLYAAASEALRAIYEEYETLTLLDVGVGDGLALLPALTRSITQIDLIEPSGAMLARTTAQLDEWDMRYRTYETTVQRFMATATGKWDIIQATWSLQSVPPDERPAIFGWMREHAQRVIIAEFDVPDFSHTFAPDRVHYIAGRYELGLAEYDENADMVAQGFLIPVMFGYFDNSTARTNWEGPIEEWRAGLRAAGFTQVDLHKLHAYFWADSYLIDAR